MRALANASIVALLGMFIGLVPLGMGIVYAIWPAEQRLALMRPLSLAAIFACVSSTVLGLVNVFVGMGDGQATHVAVIGLAESLVPAADASVSQLSPNALRMLEAIDLLPEEEREVFSLVRIQGMSHTEVADVLGTSTKTVQRRLNRALMHLADQLSDLNPTPPPADES